MSIQKPLFAPKTAWKPPEMASLPSWSEAKRICIDLETKDPQLTTLGPGVRRGGKIIGVGFAIEDGPAAYLPIGHAHGQNLPEDRVLEYLRDQARVFGGVITGANLSYDMDYLTEYGVDLWHCEWRDSMSVAEPLLNELHYSYSLDAVATRRGYPGKNEALLKAAADAFRVDPKKEMWKLPPEYVGPYAEQDVRLPLQLLRAQEKEMEDQDLWSIYMLECRVTKVLLKMRRRGVRISFDRLAQVEQFLLEREQELVAKIKHTSGIGITSLNSSQQLANVLATVGFKCPKTKTGKPSVTRDVLARVNHDLARDILRARQFNKLRTTFVKSIRSHAIGDRIHCSFHQLKNQSDDGDDTKGAAFGRLSSSDPNLQQQPARDPELGPLWRSIYLPDEDGTWVCADFSSQEPRLTIHYAEAAGCAGGREAAESCRTDPNWDNHCMTAEMMFEEFDRSAYEAGEHHPKFKAMKKLRGDGKEIFLGKNYGMGGAKLCRKLGLPTVRKVTSWSDGREVEVAGEEGQALIDRFDSRVPYVKQLAKRTQKAVQRKGFIRTILGRRCRFRRDAKGHWEDLHKALNRLIQGSAADQTKRAMVMADEAGIPLQLQVHDEFDFTEHDPKQSEQLAQIMVDAVKLNVPTVVDIEKGPSWGEIK